MTASFELPDHLRAVDPRVMTDEPPREPRRVRRALTRRARTSWALLTRPARLIPGVAAIGCALAGLWLLWGLGVALLVAVPFLLALDLRTPRG